MTENIDLVRRYMDGWKQNDLSKILSSLHVECTVIESHGPSYRGSNHISRWFELWLAAKSQILRWEMLSFYSCENNKMAVTEWDFSCISNNTDYAFAGISLIKFLEGKIIYMHEYRMTHAAYGWAGHTLNSD